MKNAITWFEIGTADLPRATAFYEAVLACKLQLEPMGPSQGAVFGYDATADGVGGALLCGPTAPQPGAAGTLVYLDASPSLNAAMARVTQASGQMPCRAKGYWGQIPISLRRNAPYPLGEPKARRIWALTPKTSFSRTPSTWTATGWACTCWLESEGDRRPCPIALNKLELVLSDCKVLRWFHRSPSCNQTAKHLAKA